MLLHLGASLLGTLNHPVQDVGLKLVDKVGKRQSVGWGSSFGPHQIFPDETSAGPQTLGA